MRFHLILLFLLVVGSVRAEERVLVRKPLQAPKAQQLIEQLGSGDYKEREQASKELAKEGEFALPFLKEALLTNEAPEVQRRLEVLIDTLKSQLAFRPSLVSIDCKNAPSKAIIKSVCKQAGYTFQDQVQKEKKITLKLTNVPFWEATDAIAAEMGLTFTALDDEKKTISVFNDETHSPHTYVNGPFRFTATNINGSRSIQLSNIPKVGRPSNQEYTNFQVAIQAEPKTVLVGVGSATVLKAVDDKGMSLTGDDETESEGRPSLPISVPIGYRSSTQSCEMALNRAGRDATVIREFRAKVAVAVLIEERPEFVIEKIMEAKKKKVSGLNCDLEVVDVSEAMGVVVLKIKLYPQQVSPNNRDWNNAQQRLVMLDDKGGKMIGNLTEQNQSESVATLTLNFSPVPGMKAGKPSKLILNQWITESREIEFKFKDIPLP